ncbi:hypothetical protein AGOR_G00123400 [Albula goreensis]|uniref:Tudor domain-containing protein n=1 Tax=Albula goreensis TaxID=1534307 RepID=A0A8T3DAW6_9TELE|nr:hypothetical protein AGOR_G00123400 [Albula goreensis]
MPLRFRSFVPYTLPGVLALIGWWWYISRKKGRITSHETEEGAGAGTGTVGLLCSPNEGSNGTGERGAHRRTSRGRSKAQEEPSAGQEVRAEVHAPLIAAVESPVRAEAVPAYCRHSDATADGGRAEAADTLLIDTAKIAALQGPEEGDVRGSSSQQQLNTKRDTAIATSVSVPGKLQNDRDPATTDTEKMLVLLRMPEVAVCTTTAAYASAVRPELEGEAVADRTPVPCADKPPSKDQLLPLAEDSHAPKPALRDFVSIETPMTTVATTMTAAVSPSSHITAVEPGRLSLAHENGLARAEGGDGAVESAGSTEEIERLAAGLITEVISAAAQEVLMASRGEGRGGASQRSREDDDDEERVEQDSGGVWEPSSSTPLANGRLCTPRDQPTKEEGSSPIGHSDSGVDNGGSSSTAGERPSDTRGEELNGCLAPSVWEEPVSARRRVAERSPAPSESMPEATPPSLARLQAEDGVGAEDSGCSTCQSEDGVSAEDLLQSTGLTSAPPEARDDLLHISGISRGAPEGRSDGPGRSSAGRALERAGFPTCDGKGLNGTGIGNGGHLTGETEADQSGGSDVNSMDSVDSGCTLGAGDSQLSGSSQTSELIIWEIEVPKHLVGRLIGKQGRYVSFLKQSSGAKIYISTLPYTQEFQICHIEGTQQQVDKALALIGKKFKDLDLTNLYAPPPLPLTLPSLPMTSWLLLPNGVTVEVIVVNIVSAGHMFVQQHTHPTYHALRSLDQQMFLCYSQPGTPALPTPAEVGVICAAPAVEGAWWRAQVISFFKDSNEVEIRYVDYGGYDRVKIDTLRQIRSDFVTLPFQGAEVLLDNIAPLPGEERFSAEANSALEEMTRGVALLAQVTNYDNNTGLPLVQMWNMVGDELVSVNRTLAERGFGTWVDSF